MANGPALSTARGGEIYVGGELRHPFSLLDVLNENQFKGETFDSQYLDQTEENFYRGAPPKWLNFHISEQAQSGGTRTPLIKRDGYDKLVEQIRQRRKRPGTSTVKLLHQPGCGGTTLAMQVLWDLKKTFRCAVLKNSTSVTNVTEVANEVVQLFTAGRHSYQNTVLLLVNDEQSLESLQDSIMMKIAEQKISTHNMSVAILFSCVRKDAVQKSDHVVLKQALSDREKQEFNNKKEMLSIRYAKTRRHEKFYGFNIMQSNFSENYVGQACEEFCKVQRTNKPKTQLAALLSLLNAYVPGSYLLESQCLDFLKHKSANHENRSLEERMKPFSDLIITFQQDASAERRVCMAHPMIAQRCTELLAKAGVTRSDTAKNFLNCLCRDDVHPFLLGFVKDMLTKREMKRNQNQASSAEIEEEQEYFSRLILDITLESNTLEESVSVLKLATKKIDQNQFFLQAVARFYYIELKDYNQAEMWAKRAKERDPLNSFIADTLGQVHKKHLKTKGRFAKPNEVLQLATKAIEAFKQQGQLAENEEGTDMKENGTTQVSQIFNNAGQFGYLEVCNLVNDLAGDNKLLNDLKVRDEIEKKCVFLERYLTYSKPNMRKNDPSILYKIISDCQMRFGRAFSSNRHRQRDSDFMQKLKQILAYSPGVLSCLDRGHAVSTCEEITLWWDKVFQRYSTAVQKKKPVSSKDAPELHLVTLLLCWPTDSEDKCLFDLNELIKCMCSSYELAYKKYFRSRYLCPLFFMGKGQDLTRIVPQKDLAKLVLEPNEEIEQNWRDEKIFKHPKVQERLLKVEGSVQNHRVYAIIDGKEIKVEANLRNSLWINGKVNFYLGFTIRGPVAFGIVKKATEGAKVTEMDIPWLTKPDLSAITGGQHFVDRHQTALINRVSDAECILNGLEKRKVMSTDQCNAVKALNTPQNQMKEILKFVTSDGIRGKNAVYEILNSMRSMRPLMSELKETEKSTKTEK